MFGGLRVQRARLLILSGALASSALDIVCVIFEVGLKHRAPAGQIGAALLGRANLLAQIVGCGISTVQGIRQLLGLRVQLGLRTLGGIQLRAALCGIGLVLVHLAPQSSQALEPQRHLECPQLIAQAQVLLCLVSLLLERPCLIFQLGIHVPDAHQIVLGGFQPPGGLLLAIAELGHARRFLKDFAAILALERQNLVNASLSDDGVAVPSQTGIHKQLVDILEAAGLFIQCIFTLARAVIPPGDHDLSIIRAKNMLGIVQNERHLGKADWPALLGTAEDNVFHLGAAQAAGRLFTQHPTDGVRDVGLAAAVGANDGGQSTGEADLGAVGKGFESLKDQTF